MKETILSILETRSTKPKHPNLVNMNPSYSRNHRYHKNKKRITNPRKQSSKHEIYSERENAYLFLEDLRMKRNKYGCSFESDTVSLREFQVRKKMNSQKCLRENWKGSKTDPFCAKHAIFVTESSRVQVAKASG